VRPLGIVKIDPVFDDAFYLKSVSNFMQVDGLLLQRPPHPFDEEIVEVTPTTVH
jgi:hypothetical protein